MPAAGGGAGPGGREGLDVLIEFKGLHGAVVSICLLAGMENGR